MTNCNGSPAELSALAYVEGTLPEAEAERFEEHYFDCPACLAYLQTIQSIKTGLEHEASALAAAPKRSNLLSWPARMWVFGAVAAALLLVGVFAWRAAGPGPAQDNAAHRAAPAAAPAPPAAPQAPGISASSLANLALPAFVAPNLRGDSGDPSFLNGMKAYLAGNCTVALVELAHVTDSSRDARAARFYTGACQMHMGDLTSAAATLRGVAGAGDSPQQESAYYYLAQVALAQNDAPAAHRLLRQTQALKGDLEQQAAAQDKKVLELMDKDRKAAGEKQ